MALPNRSKFSRSMAGYHVSHNVARHVAMATVVNTKLSEAVVECIANGSEVFAAGNRFGLVAGTVYYLVSCAALMHEPVCQNFFHRYYVIVKSGESFITSLGLAHRNLGLQADKGQETKMIVLVEQYIADRQTNSEQEVVDETTSCSEEQAHLNHALALISETRPAWQTAYEPLAPELQAGIDRCLDGIRRQMDALCGERRRVA